MTVELIYDRDCPNAEETRGNLKRALAEAGVTQRWVEWERSAPDSPGYAAQFGSPTVLVDGRDVAGENANGTISCCRLYTRPGGGFGTAPSVETIRAALQHPGKVVRSGAWRRVAVAVPGSVLSILPFGGCPACWPVYAGVLSALGLGFLLARGYLLALTVLFLSVAVLMLAVKRTRGYLPFGLGAVGAALVVSGKFAIGSDPLTYAGVALFLLASVWNAWPRPGAGCSKCAPSNRRPVSWSAGGIQDGYEQTKG